jgi:hypothetical protein
MMALPRDVRDATRDAWEDAYNGRPSRLGESGSGSALRASLLLWTQRY